MTDPDSSDTDPASRPAPDTAPGKAGDDAPIDVEFEEAPPPPPDKPNRQPFWIAGAVFLVLLLLAAAAVALLGQRSRDAAPPPADMAAQTAIAETEAGLAGMDERLTALEARPEPDPAAGPADPASVEAIIDERANALAGEIGALRAEIANLRSAQETLADESAPAGPDLEMEARLAALEQGERADAALEARLRDRLDQIEERLAELAALLDQAPDRRDFAALESRIAAIETRAAQSPAEAAYRFAILREAAARGAPFEAERAALARLRPDDSDLAAMQDAATSGVPTIEELRLSYPAARLRSAAAEPAADEPGFGAWLRRLAARLVTVRREGDDPDAPQQAVSAAETALAAGDLDSAITATERLSGPAAEAAAYWLGRANARARLERRIDAVQDSLAREAGR